MVNRIGPAVVLLRMSFIDTNGHLLHSVSFGAGPTTFVAHGGWVGSWELWEGPFQRMQSRWRCVSYDHRGAGASTFPAETISPAALVDDVFAVLDHYEVERCVLAGESLGALTAVAAVLRDPSRFEGLVLVDGVPFTDGKVDPAERAAMMADFPSYVKAFVAACVPEPASEHLRRWGEQILLRAEPAAAAQMRESHISAAIRPDYAALTVPTLVVHGELDHIVPVQAAHYVAGAIAGATLEVLPGAGHVPSVTQPAALVDVIERWWAGVAPRA